MKTVAKTLVVLESEEYDAIINAQEILSDIANLLDAEGVLKQYKSLESCFDRVDRSITDILNVIEEGIERRDGE